MSDTKTKMPASLKCILIFLIYKRIFVVEIILFGARVCVCVFFIQRGIYNVPLIGIGQVMCRLMRNE